MPLPRIVADAFGAVTISLVSIFVILSLLCIIYSIYFRSQIQGQGPPQLSYFNSPWFTRIAFILVAIWWGCGEIIRLSLLKGTGRFFNTVKWQENICKFYIISNIGFAEPSLLLILVFLLRASLQKRESGSLSPRWNRKTIGWVLLYCLPMFVLQLVLVFIGAKFINEEEKSHEMKIRKYFTSTYSLTVDSITCLYPLLNTILLGLFDCLLISYLSYLGFQMLTLVINKGLQRRIYILILSVISLLPMRVGLLGFSILPHPGGFAYEALVFLAFLMLLSCVMVGICMLVYYPIADSLALRDLRNFEMEEMVPFDDYYDGASSLMVNQSRIDTGRNSDASTKRSISFRTMIRDDPPASDGMEEVSLFSTSSPGSPYFITGRPLVPLRGVPEC